MLVILDYGVGNVSSISNMIRKIGYNSIVTSNVSEIEDASKLILPGVGAFDSAMKRLTELRIVDVLKKKVVEEKTPILGICLGMQLMTLSSEEGKMTGFGFINAKTKKFSLDVKRKVPHMGWNTILIKKNSKLFTNMNSDEMRFYFCHSYYVECYDERDTLTTTEYGIQFVSSFEHENVIGVQFHPEKSHYFGLRLLKGFIENY